MSEGGKSGGTRRMIVGGGRGGRLAGITAALACMASLAGGAPIVGVKSPAPPHVRTVAGEAEKDRRQRRWRRTRKDIKRRALIWKGVGLSSTGPRFPKTAPARATTGRVRGSDHSMYRIFTDGSLRRDPARRWKGHAAVKLAKRVRHNPHTAAGVAR